MFGKSVSEYLRFQKVALAVLAAVGVGRLVLSLAGVPDHVVVWLSMNLVGWAAVIYYGVAADRHGFTTYRQLLPLAFFQSLVFHAIAVAGILLAIAGLPNVYAAPEFSGPAPANQWLHAAAHLTIGLVAASLLWWGAASLARLVARKLAARRTAAAGA